MNDNFFSYDGPFFAVLNRVADIILLNLLWFFCSLPVVTIGASTTALMYVSMKIANGEDAYIVKKFFKSFKENFLQSTIIWLIMLVIGIVLVGNIFYVLPQMNIPDSMYNILFSASCLSSLVYAMIFVYLFPLQAKLENKIRHTFKNALLLSFRHLPSTIALILLNSVIVVLPFVIVWKAMAGLFLVWFLFAAAGIAMLCSLLLNRIFAIYIKPESIEEADEQEPVFIDEESMDK